MSCAQSALPEDETRQNLSANRPDGEPVRLVDADSDFSEGIFIAKEISRMTGGMDMLESQRSAERTAFRSFSDIAILCRTHRQADLIEKCLRHDSIPCIVTGREGFLEDSEVRGTLAFFRFLLNPEDLPSLRSSLRYIWNCPADLIDQASAYFSTVKMLNPAACLNEFQGLGVLSLWAEAVETYLPFVKKEKPRKLLERWTKEKNLSAAMEKLLQTSVFYSDTPAFLQNLLLGQEGDLMRAAGKNYESGAVRLMTLHGSKGLEFPYVYMTGMEDGLFPGMRSLDDPKELEEERRLCYVGITRARERLTMTGAARRMVNGETRFSNESMFVREIPDSLKERKDYTERPQRTSWHFDGPGEAESFRRAAPKPAAFGKEFRIVKADHLEYGPGDRVKHMKFGEGTVLRVEDGARDFEVTVDFGSHGVRKMFAGFAKLEKIG